MATDWRAIRDSFEVVDVRRLTWNFLPELLKKAGKIEVGHGICVVQSFEPIPLYFSMAALGFEHLTERISDNEYRVYFFRAEKKDAILSGIGDVPLKPAAILNLKKIDNSLADVVVHFWNLIWGKENPAIDRKTKLLLSLANSVGAGRFRQATRELVRAYGMDVSVAEMDELFSMFVWNCGVGTFASEIAPSSLFEAYHLIKTLENKGKSHDEVMNALLEKFGDKNPGGERDAQEQKRAVKQP